jgi:hypothetical protein
MAEIKQLEAILEKKHHQFQHADDKNWEEAKNAFNKSAVSFREALDNLAAFLKKSSPPPGKDKYTDYEI